MRITYLTTDSKIGGAEKVVLHLAEGILTRGFSPRIIAVKSGGSLGDEAARIGAPYSCHDFSTGFLPLRMKELVCELRTHRPDILHCHLFHANTIGVIAGRMAGVRKILVTEHGLDVIGGRMRHVARVCYARFADGVIAISESAGKKMRGMPLMPAVRVIHNGIPPIAAGNPDETLASIGITRRRGEILVASLSHFRREKGVDVLVKAMSEPTCRNRPIRLILVGSGSEEEKLRRLVGELKITERVVFAGFRSDAAKILAACDIFALSSHEEGLPITLLEAAALAKATIASDVGGVPEVIDSTARGLLVPPNRPDLLAEGLVLLADDESIRLSLGRSLHEKYRERFSLESMVQATISYYDEIAGIIRSGGGVTC